MSRLLGLPVVLLNGPPRAGKDTAAAAIRAKFKNVAEMKFAEPLKLATHELYGLTNYPAGIFENAKDERSPLFFNQTPREAYIAVSELMVKPRVGVDFFGRVLVGKMTRAVHSASRNPCGMVVVSDSGFPDEARPVIEAVGPNSVLVVRVHASKRGCTFAGDSRGWLNDAQLPGVKFIDVSNDAAGDPHSFGAEVIRRVRRWLDDREQAAIRDRLAGKLPPDDLANVIDTDVDLETRCGGASRGRAGCKATDGVSRVTGA